MTIVFHGSILGFVALALAFVVVSSFASGFSGAVGKDLGAWIRRRYRTVTVREVERGYVRVEFPEQVTKDEERVVREAIARAQARVEVHDDDGETD